jgi:hypothetical protein
VSGALRKSVAVALLAGLLIGAAIGWLARRGGGEDSARSRLGTQALAEAQNSTPENTAERGADDLAFSHIAKPADWTTAARAVRAYYAAGAAESGSRGCGLMYSLFAEEIPEVYGQPPGASFLRGKMCAQVLGKLFRREHTKFAYDNTHLRVTFVRVSGLRGLALMKFGDEPERDIRLHREHGSWKIDMLLDTEMS